MQPSPYTPGEVARTIPGRAVQLAQMDERIAYMVDLQRLVGRVRVDIAPRGIGKTSLLREVQRHAQARGALTLWITAGEDSGLVAAIADEIHRQTQGWRDAARTRLHSLLDHLTVSVGVPGVAQATWKADPPARSAAGVREFEDVVRETVASAQHEGLHGLVIFIDEIQSADEEGLRTVGYAWQHLQSEAGHLPAAVFAAGLPNSPETIASVVTFSERFAYRTLTRLSPEASMVALGGPARELGVEWDSSALEAAIAFAQGYPYTLQLVGEATWVAAGFPDRGTRLTAAHVESAHESVRADLDALFRARWEKATSGEQEFLQAMAAFGDGPVKRSALAAAMGVSSDDLSVPRARLIDKGLIDVAGRGALEFTIPGFAEYLRDRADTAD